MKNGKVVSKCGARLNKKPTVKKIKSSEEEEKKVDFFGKKKKDEIKKDNC